MKNQYQPHESGPESAAGGQTSELQPVFRIKRTDVWDLARTALHQASPDGGQTTNYAQSMSLLIHAAAFIGELAMVNARNIEELDLVGNCLDLNRLEAQRMLDAIAAVAEEKRMMFSD